ncbi:MAG: hypothetical protein ABSE48_05795 [Verrucomicrobiota bacterium]|jgi:hypothetical protein
MKNDLTTTVLNFVLVVLVFASVGFGLLAVWREPKVPVYATVALQDNNNMMKVNAILNDAVAYNATARNPELARILQAAQQKPAAH